VLVAMISSVLAVAAASVQPAVRYTETVFCERELRGDGSRPFSLVRLEVDRQHKPLARRLTVTGRGYRATWDYPTGSFDADRSLDAFESEAIELPSETVFPVIARLRFDGATVWQGGYSRPTDRVMMVSRTPRPRPLPSFQPGITVSIGAGALPSLFGVSRAEIVITAADGTEMTRSLPMPNWANLESEAVEAFAYVVSERQSGHCRPHRMVIAH